MPKYSIKCTVYLEIESDYPDGIGEAQREVEFLVNEIKGKYALGPDGCTVTIARAVGIEILPDNKLREEQGEGTDKLFYGDVVLDNGLR
jgi:hypothetical protein